MPTGACLCGEVKIAYDGEPTVSGRCYCRDCRRMANMQVFQVPEGNFRITQGQLKKYVKVSDHGREITSHFCPTCATTVYRTGGSPAVDGMVGIRAGVMDDQSLLDTPPNVEVYVECRPPWLKQIEGAIQLNGKYERVDQ